MKQGKQFLYRRGALALIGLGGLWVLSACAYTGGIENPFVQKVAWFSYLNGDDIRRACVPGAATQYRLVYNGEYDRQIRAYDIPDAPGGASYLARVQKGGGIDILNFSFSRPGGAGGWTKAPARLAAQDMGALERALEASGAFGPAPQGLELASEEFYWVFIGCRDAEVHFHAWRYDAEGAFDRLSFPAELLRHDTTGVPVNPPRDVGPINRTRRGPTGEDPTPRFDLSVGENGFWGLGPGI